jgi:hypothetical protein
MKASIRTRSINKIEQTNDEKILLGFYDILKDESKEEMLILSDEQYSALKKSQQEIAEGRTLTDAELKRRSALNLYATIKSFTSTQGNSSTFY